jgi:hypothetical protein
MADLLESDLEVEIFHAKGQPVHHGPKGVKVTHKSTRMAYVSADGASQIENKARAIRGLRDGLIKHGHLDKRPGLDNEALGLSQPERRMSVGNAFLVSGTDMVGQVYFVKASWPKCVDCDGWSVGMAIEEVNGEDVEISVCAVDGFHRAADGQRIRRFEDEDLLTRSRYR